MSAAGTMKRIAEASPHFKAGITAAFYLLTMLLGGLVLFVHGKLAFAVDLIAMAFYAGVTALFYELSRPSN
jgi:hypothetical protein